VRLAIDIGNTKTALGLYEAGRMRRGWRIGTQHWTPDEFGAILYVLLSEAGLERPDSVCYACVVPQVRHSVEGMCRASLGVAPLEVTPATAGIELRYPDPSELGSDRIANSVAAIARGRLPAIVADFGTATTFDVIDSSGAYLGGAIAPGVGTAAAELFRKAEKLSPVDLDFPKSPLGHSTSEAIRSGVLLGAAGAADRLVELLSSFAGENPALLATGGWASGLAPHCRSRFEVVPDLTLSGIDEVGRRNEGRRL
jgi:type III pantothenate kinase